VRGEVGLRSRGSDATAPGRVSVAAGGGVDGGDCGAGCAVVKEGMMYDRVREWLFAHGLDEVAVWVEVARAPLAAGVDGLRFWWYLLRGGGQ